MSRNLKIKSQIKVAELSPETVDYMHTRRPGQCTLLHCCTIWSWPDLTWVYWGIMAYNTRSHPTWLWPAARIDSIQSGVNQGKQCWFWFHCARLAQYNKLELCRPFYLRTLSSLKPTLKKQNFGSRCKIHLNSTYKQNIYLNMLKVCVKNVYLMWYFTFAKIVANCFNNWM